MNAVFCAYHGVDHEDGRPFSGEHIVPYSVGGSDDFVIDVCKSANDEAGAQVDPLLSDNFFVGSERVARGLSGQSGAPPEWTFRGTVDLEGRMVHAKYTVSPEELDLWTKPLVKRTKHGEREEIRIECDETDLDRILADINRKLERAGRRPITRDAFVSTARTVAQPNPTLNVHDTFNVRSFERPFVKMALGTAHFVFGELFSRTEDAERFRKALWEPDPARRDQLGLQGKVWPNVVGSEQGIEMLRYKDHHTLWLMNTGPVSFSALLFGKFFGSLKLSEDVTRYAPRVAAGGGIVFIIEPETRSLRQMPHTSFLMMKLNEKGA